MSDRNVTTFDIALRDAPVKKAELDSRTRAYRLAEARDNIASISSDWWSGESDARSPRRMRTTPS